MAAKRAVLLAGLDDPPGQRLADLRQQRQFGPRRAVDVDLQRHLLPLGILQLDQPAAPAAL
jgi:hypothetical protein